MTLPMDRPLVRVTMQPCTGTSRPCESERRDRQRALVCCLLDGEQVPSFSASCSAPDDARRDELPLGWSASFSSSLGVVAVAVTDRGCVGVDVERIVPIDIDEHLCAVALTEQERAHVATATDPVVAFLHLWCRKEAVLKALGTGLLVDPRRVDVHGGSGSMDDWLASSVVGFPRIWCRSWRAMDGLVMAVATDQSDAQLDLRMTHASAHESGHRCVHLCPEFVPSCSVDVSGPLP